METEENTSDGNTTLHLEIRNFYGEIDDVEILLEHDNSDINVRNSKGETPLHLAVQNPVCSAELVKLLLNRGADVKATTPDGNTALHLLAMSWKGSRLVIGVAKTLLEHAGSDVNAVNSRGETPLHLAVRNEFVFHNDLLLIKVIRAHGPDVSIVDAKGENAFQAFYRLFKRYNRGKIGLVVTLLLVPMNERQKYKIKPLHIACLCHNIKVIHKLLKIGVDVNAVDAFGNSPLHYALIAPGEIDKSVLMLMLEYDALIIKDSSRNLSQSWEIAGYNPLFIHLSKASYKIVVNIFYQHLARKLLVWQIRKRLDRDDNVIMEAMAEKYRDFLTTHVTTIVDNHVKEYKELLNRCNEEFKMMRETKIGNSNVSFLDFLLADAKQTFIYAKNKELIKAFNDKKDMFPIYQGMLDAKIDRDLERRKFIEQAAAVLSEALGFAEPSNEFFERTFSYCSNQDLMHIIMLKRTT